MDYLAGPFIYQQVCFVRGRERGESNAAVKAQAGGTDTVQAEMSQGILGVNRSCERPGPPSLQLEHSLLWAP